MRILILLLFSPLFSLAQTPKVKSYAPELFSPKISGAVCGFTNNGKTIFFVREDTLKGKLVMYQAQRIGRQWTNVQQLSFSGDYNDMGGRLTSDGTTFYFTSDRPGGSARENDVWNIWKVKLTGEFWSDPEPITIINNIGDECCPVPMPDGTLIFSGLGSGNKEWQIKMWDGNAIGELHNINYEGGWQWPSSFDETEKLLLFNSMKRPDSNGKDDVYITFLESDKWMNPINIGMPVNTSFYEDGAILSPDKKYLIFNQHESGETPSQVMALKWKPILKRLRRLQSKTMNSGQ